MANAFSNAFSDIRAGVKRRRVWITLANEDIGDQHRRTTLGPIWLLVNYLAFVGIFIFIFRRGENIPNYPAHAATGLLVWFYIMETINSSVTLFVREESFIKGTTLPLSVYVMRMAAQSFIRSAYALIGCLVVLFLAGTPFTAAWGWAVLGILLILSTAPAAITLFAFLGAFFPDSQFIVSNLTRIGMFLTPVFWGYTGTGDSLRQVLYYWNPFTYFLEIVRAPILAGQFPAFAFGLCGTISCCLWLFALILLGKLRKQVVFVL